MFKSFFEEVSADGLRYIKKGGDYSTNIYSLKGDELLFKLPKAVRAWALCPIEGELLATCGSDASGKARRIYGEETHIWRI